MDNERVMDTLPGNPSVPYVLDREVSPQEHGSMLQALGISPVNCHWVMQAAGEEPQPGDNILFLNAVGQHYLLEVPRVWFLTVSPITPLPPAAKEVRGDQAQRILANSEPIFCHDSTAAQLTPSSHVLTALGMATEPRLRVVPESTRPNVGDTVVMMVEGSKPTFRKYVVS